MIPLKHRIAGLANKSMMEHYQGLPSIWQSGFHEDFMK